MMKAIIIREPGGEFNAGQTVATAMGGNGRVFQLQDIVEAHQCMQDNAAAGKIVVLT